jgi:hypothetical protein
MHPDLPNIAVVCAVHSGNARGLKKIFQFFREDFAALLSPLGVNKWRQMRENGPDIAGYRVSFDRPATRPARARARHPVRNPFLAGPSAASSGYPRSGPPASEAME